MIKIKKKEKQLIKELEDNIQYLSFQLGKTEKTLKILLESLEEDPSQGNYWNLYNRLEELYLYDGESDLKKKIKIISK